MKTLEVFVFTICLFHYGRDMVHAKPPPYTEATLDAKFGKFIYSRASSPMPLTCFYQCNQSAFFFFCKTPVKTLSPLFHEQVIHLMIV